MRGKGQGKGAQRGVGLGWGLAGEPGCGRLAYLVLLGPKVSHWEQGSQAFSWPSEFWPHLVCPAGLCAHGSLALFLPLQPLHSGLSASAPLLPPGDSRTLCAAGHTQECWPGVPRCLTAPMGPLCWGPSVVVCKPHLRQLSDGNQSMNIVSVPLAFPPSAHSCPSGVAAWSDSGSQEPATNLAPPSRLYSSYCLAGRELVLLEFCSDSSYSHQSVGFLASLRESC